MAIPILRPEPLLHECPNCDATKWVPVGSPGLPMHHCAGLRGMVAPLLLEGEDAKVESVERGDYVNGEIIQYDEEGKAVQSVVTTRPDGQDCVVFAATARASAS